MSDNESRERRERDHANGAGRGVPASERVGESEGRSPSDDLEQSVNRELRRLPAVHAPHTLLPRVMAAVEAWAQRPWYSRAWFTWPLAWQAASVALVALVSYGIWILPSAAPVPSSLVQTTSGARIVWRTLIEPFLSYALFLIVLMAIACAAFGTALNYVFLERTADR